jgi:hypothetical protein
MQASAITALARLLEDHVRSPCCIDPITLQVLRRLACIMVTPKQLFSAGAADRCATRSLSRTMATIRHVIRTDSEVSTLRRKEVGATYFCGSFGCDGLYLQAHNMLACMTYFTPLPTRARMSVSVTIPSLVGTKPEILTATRLSGNQSRSLASAVVFLTRRILAQIWSVQVVGLYASTSDPLMFATGKELPRVARLAPDLQG